MKKPPNHEIKFPKSADEQHLLNTQMQLRGLIAKVLQLAKDASDPILMDNWTSLSEPTQDVLLIYTNSLRQASNELEEFCDETGLNLFGEEE